MNPETVTRVSRRLADSKLLYPTATTGFQCRRSATNLNSCAPRLPAILTIRLPPFLSISPSDTPLLSGDDPAHFSSSQALPSYAPDTTRTHT